MSSAPSRSRRSIGRAVPGRAALVRAVRGTGWALLFVVLAASGAGLASLAWHVPGSEARAELTYAGDAALRARLDAAAAELAIIAADVEKLADEAKTALEEVASLDPARLQASLTRGDALATAIDTRARALQASLADLPGDEPDAALLYSNPIVVRRAAILTAIEASQGLAAHWRTVALRATETSNLVGLITHHDSVVLGAAELGRSNQFGKAATAVGEALAVIATVEQLRERLISTTDDTILDEWVDRTRAYDIALRDLYDALRKSKGKVTLEVQAARREEQLAFENLPPDRRTILVIISEVTRSGLTQAVIAIEDAHGRLDEALAAAAAVSPAPA